MMRGAAQEAELHLKQAIAARFVANAPAQTSGVVFSGDIAFHYDCLLDDPVSSELLSDEVGLMTSGLSNRIVGSIP